MLRWPNRSWPPLPPEPLSSLTGICVTGQIGAKPKIEGSPGLPATLTYRDVASPGPVMLNNNIQLLMAVIPLPQPLKTLDWREPDHPVLHDQQSGAVGWAVRVGRLVGHCSPLNTSRCPRRHVHGCRPCVVGCVSSRARLPEGCGRRYSSFRGWLLLASHHVFQRVQSVSTSTLWGVPSRQHSRMKAEMGDDKSSIC